MAHNAERNYLTLNASQGRSKWNAADTPGEQLRRLVELVGVKLLAHERNRLQIQVKRQQARRRRKLAVVASMFNIMQAMVK